MLRSSRTGLEQPARILIVDDDEYVAATFQAMLRDLHPVILRARTAAEGLAVARTDAPDVAIVDLGLPDLGGLELTRRLRSESSLSHLRIVIVTGHVVDPAEAAAAGADATLTKPVRVQDFRDLIRQQLSRAARTGVERT
jgi:two-component system, OmpR family, KDP operon response regulator KdpE